MTDREVMKQVLDALEMAEGLCDGGLIDFKRYGLRVDKDIRAKYKSAIKAQREALAAQHVTLTDEGKTAQEPVAYLWQHADTGRTRIVMPDQIITADANWSVIGPLYLTPPQRQRQPLTQVEVVEGFCKQPHDVQFVSVFDAGVRFAEEAHGITGEKK